MEPLVIPKQPDSLYFVIQNRWDGTPCSQTDLHAEVWVTQGQKGITIRCHAPMLPDQRVPSAPRDTRYDGLWEYDVVEVFLVGENGKYLEVELGAGGQWLVLGFDGVRNRVNGYEDFNPDHRNSSLVPGTWQSIITIPWEMVPTPLTALNGFVIARGEFLALSPVPSDKPDFHQPEAYPKASIAA